VSHWDPALCALREASNGIYGPRSFADYLREIGADPNHHRSATLSVDTRSQLPDRLAEADAMVLQLGRAADAPGPRFALVHVPDRLDDFFLDERAFPPDDRETLDYTPDGEDAPALGRAARDVLDVHRSLPTYSERGFVHLALSTGLLSRALDLDAPADLAPPTAASSFDFAFDPHPDRPTTLRYTGGHLELDAVVPARRNGERVLLAVAANCGGRVELAKHAVGYPALAAATLSVGVDRVVPVSLRARPTRGGVRYSVYEWSALPDEGERQPCLAGFEVVGDSQYELRL